MPASFFLKIILFKNSENVIATNNYNCILFIPEFILFIKQ